MAYVRFGALLIARVICGPIDEMNPWVDDVSEDNSPLAFDQCINYIASIFTTENVINENNLNDGWMIELFDLCTNFVSQYGR